MSSTAPGLACASAQAAVTAAAAGGAGPGARGGRPDSPSLHPVPSTLSQCIHAAAALLYPFSWAHTYIPVVPESLLATVCCPTPFMVGVQMRFLQEVTESPMEEVRRSERRAECGARHTRVWTPALPLTAV